MSKSEKVFWIKIGVIVVLVGMAIGYAGSKNMKTPAYVALYKTQSDKQDKIISHVERTTDTLNRIEGKVDSVEYRLNRLITDGRCLSTNSVDQCPPK